MVRKVGRAELVHHDGISLSFCSDHSFLHTRFLRITHSNGVLDLLFFFCLVFFFF